jgi:hypothetical protein
MYKIVKKSFSYLGASYLRKSGITSFLIEIRSSFYAHFKAYKMPFPMLINLPQYIQHIYVFKVLIFDLLPTICQNAVF